jgi:Flp pilus assembly protein TadG
MTPPFGTPPFGTPPFGPSGPATPPSVRPAWGQRALGALLSGPTRAARRVKTRLNAFLPDAIRREEGSATMEFVLVIPLIMTIFMASFESGLLMVRSIMLEQSVDMTMRELRLGHYGVVTNALLKKEICARTIIFPNCENSMKIQMDRVSTASWNIPPQQLACINRKATADPVVSYGAMADNDLMMIRVCVTLQAMFPSSGIALKLPKDPDGGYGLVARTAFSIEPT